MFKVYIYVIKNLPLSLTPYIKIIILNNKLSNLNIKLLVLYFGNYIIMCNAGLENIIKHCIYIMSRF
jgi:hypothetical protein